jgi:hypothetical protein
MSLVFVASVPTPSRLTPRRTHWLPCPECAAQLDIIGELDGSDVSHCARCRSWWIDETDDATRARRAMATWRPYDEPIGEPMVETPAGAERDRPLDDRCSPIPFLGGGRVG